MSESGSTTDFSSGQNMTDANMDLDTTVKLAIYRHFASTGRAPSLQEVAAQVDSDTNTVRATYARLRTQRVLFLEADGEAIRMAPPFSGVPTQHRVLAATQEYIANCAWDALGILAASASGATLANTARTPG